jgi:hypothetical protein
VRRRVVGMKQILLMIAVAALVGCGVTSPYVGYYEQISDSSLNMPLPDGKEPKVVEVQQTDGSLIEAQKKYLRQNYLIIGESAFVGGDVTKSGLIKQAQQIGATVVVHLRKFQKTKSGVRRVTTYNYNPPTTSNHNFRGNIGGRNYTGTGSTRTKESITPNTKYVPYSEDVYAYNAIYFRPKEKEEKSRVGILSLDLTSKERKKWETNKGIKVVLVITGSAAYKADLLEGDIVLKVDGKQIENVEQHSRVIDALSSKKIKVVYEIIRKASRKSIALDLPAK